MFTGRFFWDSCGCSSVYRGYGCRASGGGPWWRLLWILWMFNIVWWGSCVTMDIQIGFSRPLLWYFWFHVVLFGLWRSVNVLICVLGFGLKGCDTCNYLMLADEFVHRLSWLLRNLVGSVQVLGCWVLRTVFLEWMYCWSLGSWVLRKVLVEGMFCFDLFYLFFVIWRLGFSGS